MSLSARTAFQGLVTNVACTAAPPGSLQDAENVVLRRVGCVEPRDGVKLLTTAANPPAYGFSFSGKDIYARYAGGVFSYVSTTGDSYQFHDSFETFSNINPQPMRRDILTVAQSRGNAYVPTDFGVVKLINGTGGTTTFKPAGIPLIGTLSAFGSNGTTAGTVWLLNGYSVAYRMVFVQTDANGVVRTSIPTGAVTITNALGATASMYVYFSVNGSLAIDGLVTSVEIYRTRSFAPGVAVDDEMQLVATAPITAASYSALSITDRAADSARGKTLYTSPSRGGIASLNEQPPAAACVASFKGSLFFANYRGPRRLKASYTLTAAATGSATGIGRRDATADFTLGNVTVLNVSNVTGWKKGMVLNSGSVFGNTWITNIVGTTVTLNQGAATTAVGAAVSAYDAIKLGSIWYAVESLPSALYGNNASWLAYYVTPPEGGNAYTAIIEKILRYSTAQTTQATHGDEYTPPLPDYDSTALAVDQDAYPGGIRWSKKDEPEHVRPDAYAFVGDAKKAILGLVPTRDALFILKEDGIFRLTGDGATEGVADPWRIDPYDPTTRCVLPSSVKPLNGRAYFLSNKGVVAFGDGGPELVSLPVHDLIRDVIDQVQANFLANGFYELNGVVGSTAAVFERENEYTLMRSSTAHPLVYNENTRAWTYWRYYSHAIESLVYSSLFTFDREGRNVYGLANALYGTRLSSDSQLGVITALSAKNDRETAVTATLWTAGTSTVTLSGAVAALADDVIQDAAGKLWRIVNATASSATHVLAGQSGATFTTGSCVLYRSLRCRVAPQTFFDAPMVGKDSSPLTVMFSRLQGAVAVAGRYSSVLTPLADDSWTEASHELITTDGYTTHSRGAAYPQDVPLAHARGWLIDAGVRWVMTHGLVRLEGLYMQAKTMAPRSKQLVSA